MPQYLRERQMRGYQYSPKVSPVPRREKYAEILEKAYRRGKKRKKEKMIICKIKFVIFLLVNILSLFIYFLVEIMFLTLFKIPFLIDILIIYCIQSTSYSIPNIKRLRFYP